MPHTKEVEAGELLEVLITAHVGALEKQLRKVLQSVYPTIVHKRGQTEEVDLVIRISVTEFQLLMNEGVVGDELFSIDWPAGRVNRFQVITSCDCTKPLLMVRSGPEPESVLEALTARTPGLVEDIR